MKTKLLLIALVLCVCFSEEALAGLSINEFVTNTENDWVELCFSGGPGESMDVSPLFVTCYYGSNMRLSLEPVTIRSEDSPDTPWDDRFIVVYMHEGASATESDLSGDINGNGILEVSCSNYSAALWNSEGVVSIDTDDDPENGGIIDFAAYSNMDGTPNKAVTGYIRCASAAGQWTAADDVQKSSIDIGANGLKGHFSVSRLPVPDCNSSADFAVTRFQTPGRENIISSGEPAGDVFKLRKGRINVRRDAATASVEVPLFVNEECSLRLRVFSSTGVMLYSTDLARDIAPGYFSLYWESPSVATLPAGIYPVLVEAVSRERKRAQRKKFLIVLGRKR